MPVALAERRVAVGRLRIRSAGGDALRVRLGVDRLLGTADVRPRRLPPAAILLVRSLADPLPGALDPGAALASLEWQSAVAAELDEWVTRAVRPVGGVVPAGAAAVLFADRAELLACLGRDWCDGSLPARWWWRSLAVDSPPAVVRAFAETPQAVPAAFEQLARAGKAVELASRLPPAAAASLARAVAAVFGVERVAEAALAPVADDAPIPEAEAAVTAVAPPRSRPRLQRPPAPWLPLLPAISSVVTLMPEQETLVGLAIALRHAPAQVRAPSFAAAVRAWRVALAASAPRDEPDLPAPQAEPPEPVRVETPVQGRRAAPPPQAVRAPPAAAAPAVAFEEGEAEPELVMETGESPVETPEEEPLAAAVETRLGGLFHLVLVGQLLGLYGDFMAPAKPGLRLDPWDFVTLLGRRLLVRPPRDPVWALLAELAGRAPADPPGRGFRPPRAWRVRPAWLEPFATGGAWTHAEEGGRLLLVHPAGFPVVDAPGADLECELRRYGLARARARTRGRGVSVGARERWVANLAAYVRARLALALGVRPRAAVDLALRRPARILVTDTRVDVVSSLADLPIEVRLAGLDRDPGYVPAAGRSLAFHFE